jgi:hypothetical protein
VSLGSILDHLQKARDDSQKELNEVVGQLEDRYILVFFAIESKPGCLKCVDLELDGLKWYN